MATRNSNRAAQNRTQSFYGKSKIRLPHFSSGREDESLNRPVQYNLLRDQGEQIQTGLLNHVSGANTYDGGFDGYRHGMRLNDAEPTPMGSSGIGGHLIIMCETGLGCGYVANCIYTCIFMV